MENSGEKAQLYHRFVEAKSEVWIAYWKENI